MLPFKPEPWGKLQNRFTKALEKIWIPEEGMTDTPSKHRENVFDFHDGLRLIISRDVLNGEKPHIHVSASWFEKPNFSSIDEAYERIVNSYKIIGGPGKFKIVGISEKGIPHFIVEDVN